MDVAVGTFGRDEEELLLVGRGSRLLFESPLHLRHGLGGLHVQLMGVAVHTLNLHMNRGFRRRVGAPLSLLSVAGLFLAANVLEEGRAKLTGVACYRFSSKVSGRLWDCAGRRSQIFQFQCVISALESCF